MSFLQSEYFQAATALGGLFVERIGELEIHFLGLVRELCQNKGPLEEGGWGSWGGRGGEIGSRRQGKGSRRQGIGNRPFLMTQSKIQNLKSTIF